MVGLTNDTTTPPVFKSSYTVCAQYDGSVALGATVTVTCAPSSQTFRYVIVQGSITEALCLLEVAVYGRAVVTRKYQSISTPPSMVVPNFLYFYYTLKLNNEWASGYFRRTTC